MLKQMTGQGKCLQYKRENKKKKKQEILESSTSYITLQLKNKIINVYEFKNIRI